MTKSFSVLMFSGVRLYYDGNVEYPDPYPDKLYINPSEIISYEYLEEGEYSGCYKATGKYGKHWIVNEEPFGFPVEDEDGTEQPYQSKVFYKLRDVTFYFDGDEVFDWNDRPRAILLDLTLYSYHYDDRETGRIKVVLNDNKFYICADLRGKSIRDR